MFTDEDLRQNLTKIDGRGYPSYKDIKASYVYPTFTLIIDHVQGDPFADPSRMRVRIPLDRAGFPKEFRAPMARQLGITHYLGQRFGEQARKLSAHRGSGKSGVFAFDTPGQEVLAQTGILVDGDDLEARFQIGLPADGRRVKGRQAASMLCDDLPKLVAYCLDFSNLDANAFRQAAEANEDGDALRAQLAEQRLVAFVADGAVLPRRSGVDERPLQADAVPFRSPESLRVEIALPNAGSISGMGIPEGVTLIVGGGFHGKSTLLNALERAVYNHRPGDGRERVAADPAAVKVRAEDGRSVAGVDISPFINHLPQRVDTRGFSTPNASGSTSQAANISEALEAGARVLLIDEDTSATNFMIRDHRMQALIAKEREPITPFIDVVRGLWEERGVSTVLVMGGSGDYFDVADTVIALDAYVPANVTDQARAVALRFQTHRETEAERGLTELAKRRPVATSMNPRKGKREESVKAYGLRAISFGIEEIDLSAVEQLVHPSQLRAINGALLEVKRRAAGNLTLPELLDGVEKLVAEKGLDALSDRTVGNLAGFRRFELAAALNRLRTLRVVQ